MFSIKQKIMDIVVTRLALEAGEALSETWRKVNCCHDLFSVCLCVRIPISMITQKRKVEKNRSRI